MREIKFRAKAIEDFETHIEGIEKGEWVYGYYYFDNRNASGIIITELQEESGGVEGCSGIVHAHIKVDYETLGQYTNLEDQNLKKIYWGDILLYYDEEHRRSLLVVGEDENIINAYRELEMALYYGAYIVGNKFENPELLEEK